MERYRKKYGQWAENVACRYLLSRDYLIIDRHWQRRIGEIDIIAQDKTSDFLVFVEVRAKTSEQYGRPEDSIGTRKKRNLTRIIQLYVQEMNYLGNYRCDVCAIERKNDDKIHLRHLKNARLD